MAPGRRPLVLIGALALVGAIVVSAVPGSLIASVVGPTPDLTSVGVVLALTVAWLGGGYLWLSGNGGKLDPHAVLRETPGNVVETDRDRDSEYDPDLTTTGRRIDSVLDHVRSRADPVGDRRRLHHDVDQIRTELQDIAAEAVADREGCARETADARVRDGSWTDDPYAASFLGETGRARLPVRRRVLDWLRGRHLPKRIEATVVAIDGVTPVEGGSEQPLSDLDSDGASNGSDDGTSSQTHVSASGDATTRHDIGLVAGIVAVIVGTALGNAAVVLSAVVCFAYMAYGYALGDPTVTVAVRRRVGTTTPVPGERVAVTLTLRNEGEEPIAGLQAHDGIPEELAVVDGEARLATSLQPGEDVSVTYHLEATPGEHEFRAVDLVVENLAGSALRHSQTRLDTPLTCRLDADRVPLTGQTTPFEGRVPTDAGGSGIEFYATREYTRGDPMNRIDWNRFASTRELTTIDYREHRAAVVVVALDARDEAAIARHPGEDDAVTLGERATVHLVDELMGEHNDVGAARLATEFTMMGDLPGVRYLPPATDSLQATRARQVLLDRDELGGRVDSMEFRKVDEFAASLPEAAQVVFVSPLLDDTSAGAVSRLLAGGHDVTVLVPDILARDTPGSRLDRVLRGQRANRLREGGAAVLRWSPDELLSVALSRPTQRGETVR
jgi:uncharacterized repeat protein (TIGR01451 family)